MYDFVYSEDESANSDSNVDNEEDEWERLQSGITRKEKVLEGKSKESHEVHCPYYPDVSIVPVSQAIILCILPSNLQA